MTSAETTRSRLNRLLRSDPRLTGWLGLLFIIAMWAVARPYRGIRHDGILYAGQTLHRLWPERFQSDLFFMFGSQDRFSAFSTMFSAFVAHFGLGDSALFVLMGCQLAFVVAVWKLAGRYTRSTRWLSTLCAAVFPHAYASLSTLGFAENFLTARSVAEPLSLFALFALSQRRHLVAAVLFALAAAMHPLIVLPALVIAWIFKIRTDRRWLWLIGLALPVLALAFAKVAPFDGLLVRINDDWWAQIHFVNRQVLMSAWEPLDWMSVAMDCILLAMTSRLGNHRLREFAVCTLWAIAGLLGAALLGVDLLRDSLIASLQLWRVLWIGHLFALMCLPAVVLHEWRAGGPAGSLVATAIVAALLSIGASLEYTWVLLLWVTATIALQRWKFEVSPFITRVALSATVVAIVTITIVAIAATVRIVASQTNESEALSAWLAALSLPVVALLLSAVILAILRLLPTPAAVALLLCVFAMGALHWDQRLAWHREIEGFRDQAHPFDRFIAPSQSVYWPDNTDAVWFMLKRSQYFSPEEGGGVVFNRSTAMEFKERRSVFSTFEIQRGLCRTMASITGGTDAELEQCSPTLDVVQGICHSPRHPDYTIFPLKLPVGLVDTWTFTPPAPASPKTYYLYDCSRI
jgi:hypothetical protein